MRFQRLVLLCVFVFGLFLIAGCRNSNGSSITPSPEHSPTPSFTPQPTVLPPRTSTPTLTSVPSLVAPRIVSTLPVEEASKKLLDLLATNDDCRLPCLWGLTPGKSTYQDAQDILAPLSSISDFTDLFPSPGDISPLYSEGTFVIYNRVVILYQESGVIDRIAFNTEAHRSDEQGGYKDVFDSEFFGEKISAFTLPHLLSEQGIPSSVMIATFGGPLTRGGTGGFDLLLLYPEKGILVNYTTQMRLVEENVRGCLANAHVQVELHLSGQADAFFETLKETDWTVKMNSYKPLQEVTSLSLEEFFEIYRQTADQCIESPANLWPMPEP